MALQLNELTAQSEALIEQLHTLFLQNVPQKGNTGEDCCLVAITNALLDLQHLVSGIEQQDLVPDADWLDTNLLSGFVLHEQSTQEAVC